MAQNVTEHSEISERIPKRRMIHTEKVRICPAERHAVEKQRQERTERKSEHDRGIILQTANKLHTVRSFPPKTAIRFYPYRRFPL